MKKITFRKKGNVILTMLLLTMVIMVISAVIFSHLTSVEASRKAQKAAQIIAETRALAIDIRLKERYGYVDVLHAPYTILPGEAKFPVPPTYNKIDQGYQNMILSPESDAYKAAVTFADTSAKEAGIKYIDGATKEVVEGTKNTKLLDVKPENICISVLPLPADKVAERKVGCGPITLPGATNTVVNYWETTKEVPIYGAQHRLNGFTGEADDLQNTIQNYNFVFVMLAYQEQTFFYKAIQRFAHGDDESQWTDPPTKSVWAIAYPQIDFCTGADC